MLVWLAFSLNYLDAVTNMTASMWLYKCTNNWNNTPAFLVSLHTGTSAVGPFLLEQIGCSGASTVSWRRWHCLEDPLSIADIADFASTSSRSSPVAQVWIGHSLGKLMWKDIGVVIVRVGEMASSVASTTTYSRDHWAEVRHDNVTMGSCFSMTMKPTEVGATGLSKGRDGCRRLVENSINLEWRKVTFIRLRFVLFNTMPNNLHSLIDQFQENCDCSTRSSSQTQW